MSELTARPSEAASAVRGEVLDPRDLASRAAEVAARQRSPETRRTYTAVYRTFAAFLGPHARAEDLTPDTVRAYRDALERAGRSPATVAKHLSALRGLADAVGADTAMKTVRSARVARGSHALSITTNGRGCCGCPTAAPAMASATSPFCISSARPGCGAPRPRRFSSATSTSAAAPATGACARRSPARRTGG